MSNNSGVTMEGLEMGRAQIVQAEAARIVPHVDMNPILLKPTGEAGSQVVLLGKAVGTIPARRYYLRQAALFKKAGAALNRLRSRYDAVVIEGAGSCAEVNLMDKDIVNFQIAELADAPVILVADIHKGGVFAQVVGTLECLPQKRRDRITGILVNRFRGDPGLFTEGSAWIEKKTKKKVLGILPWHDGIRIEAEDSVILEKLPPPPTTLSSRPAVAIVRFPHISNFNDFDPLFNIGALEVFFMEKARDLSPFRAVILPGSKNTRSDLEWLVSTGFRDPLRSYAKAGGHLLGICGGYQMLGRRVVDEAGVEGAPGASRGLCLLPVETRLISPKRTTLTRFRWGDSSGVGYEIHMGRTRHQGGTSFLSVTERNGRPCRETDGCATADQRVLGTYLHGLFDTPAITKRWLKTLGLGHLKISEEAGLAARDRQYDLLAAHFKANVDMKRLWSLFDKPSQRGVK